MLPAPPLRRSRDPGRKPLNDRKILTGINWEDLPAELGWGCGKTCKRYFEAWHEAGIRGRLHHLLLQELQEADQIDWFRGAATTPALTLRIEANRE
ncbi:transposase [Singulisphaera sp. Ch08]|uniref:Transposase n=1 Tax=Singulisphaera sp. Ch08 TaxID=3120278 RepID=A0AAU7CRR2_9BACT